MSKIFYHADKNAFFSEDDHGPLRISIPDPTWIRPLLEDGSADQKVKHPSIEIDNPECRIPADAKPISTEDHRALIEGQEAGLMIKPDNNGIPVLVARHQLTVSDIKKRVFSAIEIERDRLRYSPIHYDGTMFDADADSQALISGTLARLTRGDGLPIPWVGWRDNYNVTHWDSEDAVMVASRLRGLALAIENREAAIRVASWQKKAEVTALETVASLQAYKIQTGWPSA